MHDIDDGQFFSAEGYGLEIKGPISATEALEQLDSNEITAVILVTPDEDLRRDVSEDMAEAYLVWLDPHNEGFLVDTESYHPEWVRYTSVWDDYVNEDRTEIFEPISYRQ